MPTFGFGIRPRGPENLAEAADERHQVGGGDAAVEVDRAALDGGDEVLGADDVGPGFLGFVRLGAAREHRDAQGASRAVRQIDDAADHLVGVLRVDAEVEREFDRLVELGLGVGLDQLHRLVEGIKLGAFDRLAGVLDSLAVLATWSYPTT